jgi:catechol 2,3-dioxygenase-like lactoylglutathione lyase family enzyme
MSQTLAKLALVVRDYDEAIAWFRDVLGFELVEDRPTGPDKRWVVVRPQGSACALLLARAATEVQAQAIGRQAGGRVFLFLETDDFHRDYEAYRARGVNFREAPRREAFGTVAVFEDLYGNPWDLIGPRT